jgi:hypothetical protein
MHVGGALANEVVRGDEPSAAGHGVAPVIVAPGVTARLAVVGGVDVDEADGLVVDVDETIVELPPVDWITRRAMIATPMMTAPPTM